MQVEAEPIKISEVYVIILAFFDGCTKEDIQQRGAVLLSSSLFRPQQMSVSAY